MVETTNFHPNSNYEGSGGNRKVIERFTRVGADTLLYEFTVNERPDHMDAAVDGAGTVAAR